MERPFPYNAGRFRFAFRLHLVAITALALVAVLLVRYIPRLLMVAYLLIIAIVIVVALTLLNALPPVRTTHSVDGEQVILRQGLGFRLAIPLSKVSKARRTEVGSGRAGIHLDRSNGVLEVIASGPEAVRLRLNDPVVHQNTLVREVVLDVLEPREFIDCIRERKKGVALLGTLDGGKAREHPTGEPAGTDAEVPEEPAPAVTALASPPPVKPSRATKAPAAPSVPDPEPEALPAGREPRDRDDEDEIELVPAIPSTDGAKARVVRIPKRKA